MYNRNRRHRRWAWALQLAGVPHLYTTTRRWDPAPTQALWPEGSPTVDVIVAIAADNGVGSLRERLPPLGGIAEQSSIDVTLVSRGDAPRPAGDPGDLFARLGVQSASSWALVSGVELVPGNSASRVPALPADAEPPFRVLLKRAFTPPAGGGDFVVHVGPEAMLATAVGGTEDDVDGDPYYVEVTDRAIGGTVRRPHVARSGPRDFPVLVGPEAVFWRSRRATLFAAERRADGTLGQPFEVMRGFIERTPEPAGDGLSFPVQVTPLTALLDQAVAGLFAETRLVRGLHWHEDSAGDELLIVEKLDTQWETTARAVSAAAGGAINVEADAAAEWSARFDPDAEHPDPRAGRVAVPGQGLAYEVDGTAVQGGGGGDDNQLTLAAAGAPSADIPARSRLAGPPRSAARVRRVSLGGGGRLLRWPGAADDADHSALGIINNALGVDTHLGADGAWTTLRVTSEALTARANVPGVVFAWIASHRDADPAELGLDVYDPDLFAVDRPARRLWLPITGAGVDGAEAVSRGGDIHWFKLTAGNRYPTRGQMARAFYQTGERWLLVQDDLDVSSGEIEVSGPGYFPRRVAVSPATVEVVVPAIGSPLDGESVYLIELLNPERLPSFAERLADEVYTVRARRPSFQRSGDLIVDLLQDAAALGLTDDDVDVESILGHQGDPSWVRRWRVPETREAISFGELIGGICRLSRSALVMRTDQAGRCRMTRVPVGAEAAARVVVTIGEGDWLAGTRPTYGTDDRIINQLVLRADYGPDADGDVDFRYAPPTYASRTSQTLYQETEEETLEAAAAGDIDRRARNIDLTPRAILALYDTPRRKWRGRVGTHLGLLAHLGATVDVTSRHLRGYGTPGLPPPPVVNGLGVVFERTVDLWNEGTELVMHHYGVQAAGWNWSMQVAEVVSAVTVIVQPNRFSAPTHPVTGLPYRDLDALEIGDMAKCTPACDQGAAVIREVESLNRNIHSVTFTAAHGLGVRDWILPPPFALASTAARRHAFLADAAGEVGGEAALTYA